MPAMTFRRQLVLSIAVLVMVPAIIAALAIGRVVTANENAKADAQLQAATRVGNVISRQYVRRSARRASGLQKDKTLRAALRSGDADKIEAALRAAVTRVDLAGAVVEMPDGDDILVGSPDSVGVAKVTVEGTSGNAPTKLAFSSVGAQDYIDEVADTGGVPASLVSTQR